jgi:hypothetical protein
MTWSALLDVVDAPKTADGAESMDRMLAMMLQGLIDAEAMVVIGAGSYARFGDLTAQRHGTCDEHIPKFVGSCRRGSPRPARGGSSPRCPHRGVGSTWRCTR